MSKTIVNARVTFRKSPIHVMEQFTFQNVDSAMTGFCNHAKLDECVILQTCNRVEIYGATDSYNEDQLKRTWASLAGLDEGAFKGNIEICHSIEAFGHLLRVTAGLDSMVIGEEQVLGQVRGSITKARECGASGESLNTLFDRALKIGIRVRQATGINRGGISVGSMAVKLAEDAHGKTLSKQKILLIGTGELSTLVAKTLKHHGYSFFVASRTLNRAKAFCEAISGEPVRFESTLDDFGAYSVIFVATTAPYFMVTAKSVKASANGKNIMIIDLSNPRTVDEHVASIRGVKLVNLDEIASIVEHNVKERESQVNGAEKMVSDELPVIEASMKRLEAEPLVADVFHHADKIRKQELEKAMRILGNVDEKTMRIMTDLTRSLMEGIVSGPIDNIRKASEQGDDAILKAAQRLFKPISD